MTSRKSQKFRHNSFQKILSILGLFTITLFTIAMLFVGFANIEVHCLRNKQNLPPECQIRETRLWGLYNRRAVAKDVTGVGYRTSDVDTSSRVMLASTVILEGLNGSTPVSIVTSNVGDSWKADLITKTRSFLNSASKLEYFAHVNERNVFGWIGVAIIAFVGWAYIMWFFRKASGHA